MSKPTWCRCGKLMDERAVSCFSCSNLRLYDTVVLKNIGNGPPAFESDAARVHRDIERFTAHMERAGVPGWERPKPVQPPRREERRSRDLVAASVGAIVGFTLAWTALWVFQRFGW